MKDEPKIEISSNFNPEDYDLIFIGTPVWAFNYCPPIRTFFKEFKFNNKKVVVFCTHDGGMKNTLNNMKDALVGNDVIGELDIISVLKDINNAKQKVSEFINNLKI